MPDNDTERFDTPRPDAPQTETPDSDVEPDVSQDNNDIVSRFAAIEQQVAEMSSALPHNNKVVAHKFEEYQDKFQEYEDRLLVIDKMLVSITCTLSALKMRLPDETDEKKGADQVASTPNHRVVSTSDFKLQIKLQSQTASDDTPSIEIVPFKRGRLQYFAMHWTRAAGMSPVVIEFPSDQIDNLVSCFLVDHMPCHPDDTHIIIYTVDARKQGSFNDNKEMIYGQFQVWLRKDRHSIEHAGFRRCLEICAGMKHGTTV